MKLGLLFASEIFVDIFLQANECTLVAVQRREKYHLKKDDAPGAPKI